ncbi:MAG TPA: TonB-dependent receptor [Rhizomicrobium sp.]|jgi:outer membrane receptor protein involved in Fe transport
MGEFHRRYWLATAAILLGLTNSGTGLAQDSGNTANHGQAIEQVVVTATRRAEKIERVPVSISAFSDAKMDVLGVKNFADLAKFTPGVTFDPDTNNVYIRGIDSTAGSGTTGIYIDDTPIQIRNLGFSSNNTLPSVFDLERVEVLRGPQGTLFGAGSEGGTVRYITPQPSLTDYSGIARSEISFTDGGQPSYEDGAAFGGPIVDNVLGFRASAWYRRDGGWIDQTNYHTGLTTVPDANGTDTYVLRGALTWAPVPQLTITPAIDYQNRNEGDPDQYWIGLSNPDDGDYKTATPDRQVDKDRFYLASLDIHYTGNSAELISNTSMLGRGEHVNGYSGTLYNLSYFQQILLDGTDPEGVPCGPPQCKTNLYPLLTPDGINLPGLPDYVAHTNITNTQHDVTEEVRLQSTNSNSPLTWVLGVFYAGNEQESKEEINDPQLPQITRYLWNESVLQAWSENLLPNGDDYINDTLAHDSQIAAFADATYAFTDQWKLEGGLRYARTHFDFTNYADGPQNFGPSSGNGKESESPITPKISVDFQATPDDLIYATVAEGYRIGGANPPFPLIACGVPSVPSAYSSDTTWSYELGAKDKWLGGRLQTDASVYYIQWSSIQQDVYLPLCGLQYTSNLGNAVSKGFDFQADYQVTGSLHLEMSLGYTDARYTSNAYSVDGSLLVGSGEAIGSQPYISPWTFTAGAEYDFEAFGNESYARLDDEFASENNWPLATQNPLSESYDPHLVSDPATNSLAARAGMTFDNWDAAIFMNNVLDSHPRLDLNHQDTNTLLYEASTFRPRTTGIEVNYRF